MSRVVVPRVIATDLDGTLLRSDGTVSPRTRAALAHAEQHGCTVLFVSARPPRWIDELADAVGDHGLAICANGALIYDVHARAVIERHSLAGDVALTVAQAIRQVAPGVSFAIERDLGYGHEPDFPGRWPAPEDTVVAELDALLIEPVAKLLALHQKLDAQEFIALASAAVGDLAAATHSGHAAVVEISAANVSKATSLARFCAERGIGPADVVAFGDMPNDVPMLAWAGKSYAVGNAHPAAVAAADHRCASNDEDGVARVVEGWFG